MDPQPVPTTSKPATKTAFVAGIDVGGTKVHIADSTSTSVRQYNAPKFPDMYAVLDEYFEKVGARPSRMVLAMAGVRNSETGEVRSTNLSWPPFNPQETVKRYPGTIFETVHDMKGAAAGILHATGVDLKQLKPGIPATNGTKIAVTISTGVGVCAAIWDERTKEHFFYSGELGHVGFQPYNEAERRHLEHIFTKHRHPSVELAISGKHGVESWIEHSPEMHEAPELAAAVARAQEADRPVGAVLLEFATEGSGVSREAAHAILDHMGTLVGSVLADFTLAYMATGGVYLTGSVSLGLTEYWAEHTDFNKAFVRSGPNIFPAWLEDVLGNTPIYLVTNPNIGVAGALALAKQQA